jgi:hypothetical protein
LRKTKEAICPAAAYCPHVPIVDLDKGDIIYRETMYSVVES